MYRKSRVALRGAWALVPAFCVLLGVTAGAQDDASHSAHIRGQFVDNSGAPVVSVELHHSYYGGKESTSASGTEGGFDTEISWQARGDTTWYELTARRFGYSRYYFKTEHVRSGDTLDLGRIVLQPGGAVAGRILDESGAPLKKSSVLLVAALDSTIGTIESSEQGPDNEKLIDYTDADDHGAFDLVGVSPGRYLLWFKHDSTYWHSSTSFELKAAERVHAGEFVLHPLPPDWSIEGFVLDLLDKPIAGATVSSSIPEELTESHGDVERCLAIESTTDALGHFVLYMPRKYDKPLELEAEDGSGEFNAASVKDIKLGARDVRIHLGGMRDVDIFVTDAKGAPIEMFGWRLTIESERGTMKSGEQTKQHAGGRAKLRVPIGAASIEISLDSYRSNGPVAIPAGTREQPLTIVMAPLGAFTGTVICAGRPIPDARVELAQRHPNGIGKELMPGYWDDRYYGVKKDTARSDPNGFFTIPHDFPPAGPMSFTLGHPASPKDSPRLRRSEDLQSSSNSSPAARSKAN